MSDAEEVKGGRETLLVVDGHSLAFRAFFAVPVENFSTSQGQATNAVWGFANMLSDVIEAEKPDHLAVAFDVKGGTFRSTMLPQYKGTRDAAPDDLLTQLPLIQKLLKALGVTYIEKPGYEGDDVIATLATMGESAGYHTLVVSGDRDAFQLITDDVTVLYPGHHFKDLKHMTPAAVEEKYHITPAQYPDLAALRGETADNIPGVPGVGDGYAAKWINEYGSLDGIIEHADEITGKKGEALRESIEQVKLNRKVNALVRDVDLGLTVEDLVFGSVNKAELEALFKELEFGMRIRGKLMKAFTSKTGGSAEAQQLDVDGADTEGVLETPQRVSVRTQNEFASWLAANSAQGMWAVAAWGSNHPGNARLDTLAIATKQSAALIDSADLVALRESVNAFLNEQHNHVIVYGYKELLHMLAAVDLDLDIPLFDAKLASYLTQPDFHADTIEDAVEHFLNIQFESDDQPAQGMLDFGDDESESNDADRYLKELGATLALYNSLNPVIEQRNQTKLLHDMELPVSRVLNGMERIGAAVDMQRLLTMRDQFAVDANQAQEAAWQAAGVQVNLQSPKQLQKILFDDMGLKPTRRTKSGTYTTNAAALQELYLKSVDNERANAFLGALLRHRETNKLKQIVQSLIDTTNKNDGCIHTTFEQTVAATGRLSSVDPNLQNIPNRNAQGREIRGVFVPSQGYESLLSCDYSQVELRIMAHLSGDEALIEAFKSGADFHKYVASMVYGLPVDQINSDQRSHVKAMSYGLAYGLSTFGLAQQLKISPSEANALKDRYFATFGKVREYLDSLVDTARERGYTETMFGRRRYFPALRSTNHTIRDAAERGALNAPIQGSAADIMKIAMIRTEQALREHNVKSRIVIQIHDELVIEVAPGESQIVSDLVRSAMEHAVELAVPLDVSIGIGPDWQLAAH